ncbi:hypothetical protein OSTOST_20920 [Ostertagia ostertagi]
MVLETSWEDGNSNVSRVFAKDIKSHIRTRELTTAIHQFKATTFSFKTTNSKEALSRFKIDAKDSTADRSAAGDTHDRKNTPTTSHPMITRSKARRLSVQNLLLSMMIMLLPYVTSTSNRCPERTNDQTKGSLRNPCVTNEVAIATYTEQEQTYLCWFPVTCPNGKIRATFPLQSVHSSATHEFLNFIPTDVCSFSKSGNCSSRKKIGTFNQIELFGNSVLLVPRLQITIKDYLNSSDSMCINAGGERVSTAPPFQGTSVFCENHSCSDHVSKFCIYDTSTALHDFSNTKSSTILSGL